MRFRRLIERMLSEFDFIGTNMRPDTSGERTGGGTRKATMQEPDVWPYDDNDDTKMYGQPQAYDRGSGGAGPIRQPLTPTRFIEPSSNGEEEDDEIEECILRERNDAFEYTWTLMKKYKEAIGFDELLKKDRSAAQKFRSLFQRQIDIEKDEFESKGSDQDDWENTYGADSKLLYDDNADPVRTLGAVGSFFIPGVEGEWVSFIDHGSGCGDSWLYFDPNKKQWFGEDEDGSCGGYDAPRPDEEQQNRLNKFKKRYPEYKGRNQDFIDEAMGTPTNFSKSGTSQLGSNIPGMGGSWSNNPPKPWDDDEELEEGGPLTINPAPPDTEEIPNQQPEYSHDQTDDELEKKLDRIWRRDDNPSFVDADQFQGGSMLPSDIFIVGVGNKNTIGVGRSFKSSRGLYGLIPKESIWIEIKRMFDKK